jgi:hypothetical protein
MRDVVLLRAPNPAALDAAIARARALLEAPGDRRIEVAKLADGGLAIVQAEHPASPRPASLHRTPTAALGFSGYVDLDDAAPAKTLHGQLTVRTRWLRSPVLAQRASVGGIYAAFLADAATGAAFAWSSLGGVEVPYYTVGPDVVAVSNRPLISHLIGTGRERPTFDATWAGRILLGDSTLWDDTPYAGTFAGRPRSTLVIDRRGVHHAPHPLTLDWSRLDRDEAITALHDAALRSVEVLRGAPTAELQLSGGKDSRLVAALMARAGLAVDAITFGPAERGEAPVAARIAAHLGIAHRTMSREITTGDRLAPTMLRNLQRSDGMIAENRHLAFAPLAHAVGQPVLEGQAHHPRGGFRTRFHRSTATARKKLHEQLAGDAAFVRPELVTERTARVDALLDRYRVRHAIDLPYWMYADWRMSRWLTAAWLPSSRERLHVMPMLDERVLQICARLPARDRALETIYYGVLERLAPGIGRIPLYEDTWKFDAAGDNGPFPDGRAERIVPHVEPPARAGKARLSAEKRTSTILPLARSMLADARSAAILRTHVRPEVVTAILTHDDPAAALGLENQRMVRFLWKLTAVAMVLDGDWLDVRADQGVAAAASVAASSGAGGSLTGTPASR